MAIYSAKNGILSNTMSIEAPRQELLDELREAIELQRAAGAKILAYRFGFLRLPFVKDRYEDGYNLHAWLPQLPSVEQPHSHIFDMESRVLLGQVQNHIWRTEPDETGDHCLMIPEYDGNVTRDVVQEGRHRLHHVLSLCTKQDDVYRMPKLQHHTSTLPPDQTVVTLIRKSNIDPKASSSSIVPADYESGTEIDLGRLTSEEAWRLLDEAMEKVW